MTFLVLDDGRAMTNWDGCTTSSTKLGGIWRLAGVGPYRAEAHPRLGLSAAGLRNRYKWFGKRYNCYLP